ncbi:hypothetical protein H5410_032163 [Solanum commersonii]|uniref:Uncharacterized protein n=1 Tax=Solanum commersonii TaxID=4109 RepID=A0A9J5YKC1_SOLCO|nr:hypothetical protein H5410_032163 [Solanum commersonii]
MTRTAATLWYAIARKPHEKEFRTHLFKVTKFIYPQLFCFTLKQIDINGQIEKKRVPHKKKCVTGKERIPIEEHLIYRIPEHEELPGSVRSCQPPILIPPVLTHKVQTATAAFELQAPSQRQQACQLMNHNVLRHLWHELSQNHSQHLDAFQAEAADQYGAGLRTVYLEK